MATESLTFDINETIFAELLIPVPVAKLFTYRVPVLLNSKVKTGQRAIVPFGTKKIQTGVIISLHNQPPKDYDAKYIFDLLDENEIIYPLQFQFYEWIAEYYLCTPGE